MQGWLKVEGDARATINALLGRLLAENVVDALLVPLRTPDDRNVVPTLIRDPALLERADPLAPVMPRNAATVLGRVTATGDVGRLGAVLRPCEVRTAVELAKVRQTVLDDVLLISVDCLGTYKVDVYAAMVDAEDAAAGVALESAREGRVVPVEGRIFRSACTMCERPIPSIVRGEDGPRKGGENGDSWGVDLAIGLLGVPNDRRLWVSVRSDELGASLGLEPAEEPAERTEAVQALIEARTVERDRRFAALTEQVHGPQGVLDEFATCIGCQNCMVVCPICYCKECVFRTDVFDHPSARYWDWAERKGGVRLPADTILFHLTRMLHMAHACVGCGVCSDGCPVGIPVADIFRAVGGRVQARFDYVPGRDPQEEMVIATFYEHELETLGK